LIAAAALLALAGPTAAVCPSARPDSVSALDLARDDLAHRSLRRALKVATPRSPVRIAVFDEGGHMVTTRTSIIASRDADGRWRTTSVGRSEIWIGGATPMDLPQFDRTLSIDQGRRIDELLAEPAFWREAPLVEDGSRPPPLGQIIRTVDVITPHCVRRVVSLTYQPPLLAEINYLVTP
jgi:hypothetical protein